MPFSRSTQQSAPRPFRGLVGLLLRTYKGLRAALGQLPGAQRKALELSGVLLLTGLVTAAAGLGLNPVLTVAGGLGLAVLYVVARSFVVALDRSPAAYRS